MKIEIESPTLLIYCVTSYGKIVGCYEDSQDAFQVQLNLLNSKRIAELVPVYVQPKKKN